MACLGCPALVQVDCLRRAAELLRDTVDAHDAGYPITYLVRRARVAAAAAQGVARPCCAALTRAMATAWVVPRQLQDLVKNAALAHIQLLRNTDDASVQAQTAVLVVSAQWTWLVVGTRHCRTAYPRAVVPVRCAAPAPSA